VTDLWSKQLSASERKHKTKEIIAASGADTAKHFQRVVCGNHGITFREQAQIWLEQMKNRKRKPVAFAVASANMAWVDAEEGKDLDLALGMAQKAKSEMPELPSITDTLAWVMYKRGNYSAAIPLLQECVQKAPNSAEYHYHLGVVLTAAGQKDRGKSQLQAALQMKQLKNAEAQLARRTLLQTE
jgi:tetratricopeptide (TPR) repeat protein